MTNLFVDEAWMKNQPMGQAVEGMRKWGIKPKREREGVPCEPYAMVLYYYPNPQSDEAYLVVDGRSWKNSEADRWHDEITIQIMGGNTYTMADDQLAGVRAREHWQYRRETLAEQREAMQRALVALGIPLSRRGYQAASKQDD